MAKCVMARQHMRPVVVIMVVVVLIVMGIGLLRIGVER